jgi:CBS domain-containing protein
MAERERGIGGGEGGHRAPLSLYSPLSAIMRRELAQVPLSATVRVALETMDRKLADCVVVTDPSGRVPLGVFTLQDLVRRVTLPGGDLEQPIAGVMTSGLVTLTPQATAHQAALTMARAAVRRLLVVDVEGRLAGMVGQEDLFGLQEVGVKEVSNQIQAATDVEGLRRAALGIGKLADSRLAQGIGAETLTHFISTLNDLLTIRVIELTADEFDLPPVPMCWIALGSEGRLEQTFSTDQDNGIIFEADDGEAEQVRQQLLPFARAVNRKLDACGFPLCKGDYMAGNPRWCLRPAEWRRAFAGWIEHPEPRALLNASIFFDLRPIYGNQALAERLREWVLGAAAARPLFLRFMAENAVQIRPPLGTFRDFIYQRSREFPHTIDLKMHGSLLFVDAARILALAHGVPHTSTAQRLRGVADAGHMSPESLAGAVDGFYFVHLMRLRQQREASDRPGAANRIDPRRLRRADRYLLKDALRQAGRLQSRLVQDYQLATY